MHLLTNTFCLESPKTTETTPNSAADRTFSVCSVVFPLERVTFKASVCAANICGPKRQQWKVFQVWVCLLLAGVINSGGALVRDLSTQIWITRQRNLARSNLWVWYLHESKRECEASAANNRNSRVFCVTVVLQLVFVPLSNNIFMNTATNVNNMKINFFFFMATRFEAKVILSAPKRRKSQANADLKNIADCVWTEGCWSS